MHYFVLGTYDVVYVNVGSNDVEQKIPDRIVESIKHYSFADKRKIRILLYERLELENVRKLEFALRFERCFDGSV